MNTFLYLCFNLCTVLGNNAILFKTSTNYWQIIRKYTIYELHAVDENKNDINMLFLLNNVCTWMKIIKCVVCALIQTCVWYERTYYIIYIILMMFIGICMCSQQITLFIQCLKVHACHPLICGCKQHNDLGPPWPSSSSLASWRPRCSRSECAKMGGTTGLEFQKIELQYSLDLYSVQFATQWWTSYNSNLEMDQMQMFEIWVSHIFSPKSSMVFSAPIHPPVTVTIPAPFVFSARAPFVSGKYHS